MTARSSFIQGETRGHRPRLQRAILVLLLGMTLGLNSCASSEKASAVDNETKTTARAMIVQRCLIRRAELSKTLTRCQEGITWD